MARCSGCTGSTTRSGSPSARRAQALIGRIMIGEKVPEGEMFETFIDEHSIIVGTPDECRKKVKTYQEIGIDRLMCLHQVGALRYDKVMKSIRLFSEQITEFDKA